MSPIPFATLTAAAEIREILSRFITTQTDPTDTLFATTYAPAVIIDLQEEKV
jgi:hypothetical protein